jgi:competence protein ComEA
MPPSIVANPPVAPPPSSAPSTRPLQLALAFVLGAAAVLLLTRFAPLGGPRPTERERIIVIAPVDLNQAGKAEFLQLPGVGEATAEKILAERESRGGFHRVDDVRQVKGIGPAKMTALRPWLEVDSDHEPVTSLSPPNSKDKGSRSAGGKKEALPANVVIDVNHASAAELQRLPGVGPVLAQRIITEREKKPFRSLEDLRRVSGIGPKTLEKLRPHLSVGELAAAEEITATRP